MDFEWDELKAQRNLAKHGVSMSQETKEPLDNDLRDEYDETVLKNGIRGKYIQRLANTTRTVRLAPDVAAAFPTEEAVNEALPLLLHVAKTTVREAA